MKPDSTTEERLRRCGVLLRDVEESFTRSSGPGGQHVNKVSTACTLRHVPTGVSVTASDSRSQVTNRKLAMERLLAEFESRAAERKQARLAGISKARRQKATRSRGTKRQLVESKRKRGEVKKLRGRVADG